MAEDGEDRRFVGGPRALAALLPRLTRPAFRRRSPAGAALMADWPMIVGPSLAVVTEPLRFAGGTLTIACAGPVAMELTHLAPQLLSRINGQLGAALVQQLRFVQRSPATRSAPAPIDAPAELFQRRAQGVVRDIGQRGIDPRRKLRRGGRAGRGGAARGGGGGREARPARTRRAAGARGGGAG